MPMLINGYRLRPSARHGLSGGRKRVGIPCSRDRPKPSISLCFLQLSGRKKFRLNLFTSYFNK